MVGGVGVRYIAETNMQWDEIDFLSHILNLPPTKRFAEIQNHLPSEWWRIKGDIAEVNRLIAHPPSMFPDVPIWRKVAVR